MLELLALVVLLAIAIALGLFLFAHLGTVVLIGALILVGVGGLAALVWLFDAVVSLPSSGRSTHTLRSGAFVTPRGTPYITLRRLALNGAPPTRADCEKAEREAREAHQRGAFDQAASELLIARSLWSAWRANQPTISQGSKRTSRKAE